MSPKSRRKSKKYSGPRQIRTTSPRPEMVPVGAIREPAPHALAQSKTTGPKTVDSPPPSAVYTNVTREMKTIGFVGGVLLVVLIILAKILS